jgi:hypothetical protein
MKCALAALALASIFSSPAWAQDQTRSELVASGPAVQFAAPGPACTTDSVDPACANAGLFQPTYDISHEFDGYYTGLDSRR